MSDLASATPQNAHITQTPGVCGGKPCIAGSRIRVLDIYVWHELNGMSPDEIVSRFPQLSLADVYAALSDFWDHRELVLADPGPRGAVGQRTPWPIPFPPGTRNIRQIIDLLALLDACVDTEEMKGRVEFVPP